MNRYSLVNRNDSHAHMEVVPAGDWVLFTDASEAMIQLEAWQKTFGTTQLTHALTRLEAAEKQVSTLERKLGKSEHRRGKEQQLANLRND